MFEEVSRAEILNLDALAEQEEEDEKYEALIKGMDYNDIESLVARTQLHHEHSFDAPTAMVDPFNSPSRYSSSVRPLSVSHDVISSSPDVIGYNDDQNDEIGPDTAASRPEDDSWMDFDYPDPVGTTKMVPTKGRFRHTPIKSMQLDSARSSVAIPPVSPLLAASSIGKDFDNSVDDFSSSSAATVEGKTSDWNANCDSSCNSILNPSTDNSQPDEVPQAVLPTSCLDPVTVDDSDTTALVVVDEVDACSDERAVNVKEPLSMDGTGDETIDTKDKINDLESSKIVVVESSNISSSSSSSSSAVIATDPLASMLPTVGEI